VLVNPRTLGDDGRSIRFQEFRTPAATSSDRWPAESAVRYSPGFLSIIQISEREKLETT